MYVYTSSFRQKALYAHLTLQHDISEIHTYYMLVLMDSQSKNQRLVGRLEISSAKLRFD